jgi:hypothetical protein
MAISVPIACFLLGWGESQSTWHVGQQVMNEEQPVELELAKETEMLGENLPQCHFVCHIGTAGESLKKEHQNPHHSQTVFFPWP